LNILVIAAHPDDEVLGMGATINKLTKEKNNVHLCVVTEGATAQYDDKKMIKVRKNSCIKAGKILGIKKIEFLEYPDMLLDIIPQLELNKKIEKIINKLKPDIVFTTPQNDLNRDHQLVFESTLVATRPHSSKVKKIFSYEIPSTIKEPFFPNTYFDISKEFNTKIKALKAYTSEIMKFPQLRSINYIESLASVRGAEAGLNKAEAFRLIRSIEN
jgi:LmbE family N-acetylglucosaminyl deacetylase